VRYADPLVAMVYPVEDMIGVELVVVAVMVKNYCYCRGVLVRT